MEYGFRPSPSDEDSDFDIARSVSPFAKYLQGP